MSDGLIPLGRGDASACVDGVCDVGQVPPISPSADGDTVADPAMDAMRAARADGHPQ